MSSPRPSRGLGCRELWREGAGGETLSGKPRPPPHPPATRRLGSPECPGCPGLAPPCAGVRARSRGLGGPAAGTRIRGALWTPRARGPRAPRRPWPRRAGVRAARGCAGTRPRVWVWKPRCEPGACAHPTAGGGGTGDACPLQCCRSRQGESQLLAPDAAGFGAFPHPALLGRTL